MQGEAQQAVPDAVAACRSVTDRAELYLFMLVLVSVPLAMGPYTAPEHLKWLILNTASPTLVAVWLFRRGFAARFDSIAWALLAMLAAAIVSTINATNVGLSLVSISKGIGLFSVYFLAAHVPRDDRDRDRVLWALAGCGFVVAAYGIAQHYGYDFFPWAPDAEMPFRRAPSSVGHPTFAASMQVMILPLIVALCRSGKAAAIATLFGATQLLHLQFTGARGPALALSAAAVVAVLLILAGIARKQRRLSAGVSVFVLLAAAISALILVAAWREKASDPLAVKEGGTTLRLNTWETASRLFVAHPVLGVGAGNYPVVSPGAWNALEAGHFMRHNRNNPQVHNEYLQTAAEQGVLGLGALLFLVVASLGQAFRAARWAPSLRDRRIGLALLVALVAAYVDAFGLFTLQVASPAVVLWALLGMLSFMGQTSTEPSD